MRICIPIREKSCEKIIKKLTKIHRINSKVATVGFEIFVEIWLDELKEEEISKLFKKIKLPVVAVCKAKEEKGSFKGSEKQRIERLEMALRAGARFVDCGIHTNTNLIKKLKQVCFGKGSKLIISKHFWNDTPAFGELLEVFDKAKKLGADIVKIAVKVKTWEQNVILFELAKLKRQESIIVGMGDKGKISRIACPILGSFLTYVALDEKSKTARGQWTVREMVKRFR